MSETYDIVILGLSITSSWGNGHATTYRSLIRGLAARGHRILFLERDTPWYAGNRDEPHPAGTETVVYASLDQLMRTYEREVAGAGLVIVGSFVPDGAAAGDWVLNTAKGTTAFYDIDTPVTLAKLAEGSQEYITAGQIARYHIYFSFTGGPALRILESRYGSRMARPLYCSVDPELYRPMAAAYRWDLGYLGTYSADRQPALDELLLQPARHWERGRFAVVGPMYPDSVAWPSNVMRDIHLSPREHPAFYGSQRFTLNLTRAAMKAAGYSPSVRLFEAGACGAPIISDWWDGLDTFLEPGKELLVASREDDVLRFLKDCPEDRRLALGAAARSRMLAEHTPAMRAVQLESCWKEAHDNLSADSSRRHRRREPRAGGIRAGVASECAGDGTGGDAGPAAIEPGNPGGVHKPTGAGG